MCCVSRTHVEARRRQRSMHDVPQWDVYECDRRERVRTMPTGEVHAIDGHTRVRGVPRGEVPGEQCRHAVRRVCDRRVCGAGRRNLMCAVQLAHVHRHHTVRTLHPLPERGVCKQDRSKLVHTVSGGELYAVGGEWKL